MDHSLYTVELTGAALKEAEGAEHRNEEAVIVHGGGPDYEGEDLVNEDEEDTALFPMGFEGEDFTFLKDDPDFGVADLPWP